MRVINALLCVLYFSGVSAQVNTAFIQHLDQAGLLREHRAYLNTLPLQNDSTAYFEAKFNLRYFNDSLFLQYYSKSTGLCNADSALTGTAGKLFLVQSRAKFRDIWFALPNTQQKSSSAVYFSKIYKASLNPCAFTKDDFVPELQPAYLKYRKIYTKKPVLGGMLSTLVPGLGKLYAGKPKSALLTFLLNAGYAAQTIESAKKLGNLNAFTIINAGAFTLFYLSNIYGSYTDIVTLKKERKKQFLADATNFYN